MSARFPSKRSEVSREGPMNSNTPITTSHNLIEIKPYILGRGRAGAAIEQALSILNLQSPTVRIHSPIWLERSDRFKSGSSGQEKVLSLAIIANPNGLHAERLLEADAAGFDGIATEKPACVSIEQSQLLAQIKSKVAVFHVYRQMWGPQKLKQMVENGEFGKIITIEGRYWQSSTAERALIGKATESWKNELVLSGPSDALIDVGTHWADMAVFLMGEKPVRASGWASYENAERPHRDTHVQLVLEFESGRRAMSSISKTLHGATNHFEINIIGTRAAATWSFLKPDEIFLGEGRNRRVLLRSDATLGTQHPPFHGAGWLEGYVEILRQLTNDMRGTSAVARYPELHESRALIEVLLRSNILNRARS